MQLSCATVMYVSSSGLLHVVAHLLILSRKLCLLARKKGYKHIRIYMSVLALGASIVLELRPLFQSLQLLEQDGKMPFFSASMMSFPYNGDSFWQVP